MAFAAMGKSFRQIGSTVPFRDFSTCPAQNCVSGLNNADQNIIAQR